MDAAPADDHDDAEAHAVAFARLGAPKFADVVRFVYIGYSVLSLCSTSYNSTPLTPPLFFRYGPMLLMVFSWMAVSVPSVSCAGSNRLCGSPSGSRAAGSTL